MKHLISSIKPILVVSTTALVSSCNAGIVAKRTSDRALGKKEKTEPAEFHAKPEAIRGFYELSNATNADTSKTAVMADDKFMIFFDQKNLEVLSTNDDILKSCADSLTYEVNSSNVLTAPSTQKCDGVKFEIMDQDTEHLKIKTNKPVACGTMGETCDILVFNHLEDLKAARQIFSLDQKYIVSPKFKSIQLAEANADLVANARSGFKTTIKNGTIAFNKAIQFTDATTYFYDGKYSNNAPMYRDVDSMFSSKGTICAMSLFGKIEDANQQIKTSGILPINTIEISHLVRDNGGYSIHFRTKENNPVATPYESLFKYHEAQNDVNISVIVNQDDPNKVAAIELTCYKDHSLAALSDPITISDVKTALGSNIILN
jgi:hypothetical protein